MKALALIFTFLISFSVSTMLFAGSLSDLLSEEPEQDTISTNINSTICTMVGINGMTAQRNKNNGVTVEETTRQMQEAIDNDDASDSEPAKLAHELSFMTINAIYDADITAATNDEIIDLGVNIYQSCMDNIDGKIMWEIE